MAGYGRHRNQWVNSASLVADERNKSRNATVQEMRKVYRRLLCSVFVVVVRDYLQALLEGAAIS